MRFEGTLSSWNDDRGFGFIEPEQGGEPIFAHVKAFSPGTGRPTAGMRVSFEVETGPKGKRTKGVQALRRVRSTGCTHVEAPVPWSFLSFMALPAFLAIYVWASIAWTVSPVWIAAYAVASIITFFVYAFDKTAAVRKTWRTSEQTLHVLGFCCGWPGALLAQQALRHKSSKLSFRVMFWLTVVANVAAFVAIHSPFGKHLISGGAV